MKKRHKIMLGALAAVAVIAVGISPKTPLETNPGTVVVSSAQGWKEIPFGEINSDVTQGNINSTICVSGWTATIRPATSYTNKIKQDILAKMGFSSSDSDKFELDHYVPLELGGHPKSLNNLWLEPWTLVTVTSSTSEDLGAHSKDKVENYLKREVCAGRMTLKEAQDVILNGGWIGVYRSKFEKTL